MLLISMFLNDLIICIVCYASSNFMRELVKVTGVKLLIFLRGGLLYNVSATIRGKFLSHLFLEVFCQSCTLGFVPLFPKSVGHTVSENIYLSIILCHRIP